MKTLPALRILPVLDRTFGPRIPTGMYVLVVNWDPQDPSFVLKDKAIPEGGYGKHTDSWTQAYTAALAAIEKIDDPGHRKILRRGLTPIPLTLLNVAVAERPLGEADFIGATYSWQFIGDTSGDFNVYVDETNDIFEGIHDTR